MMISERSGQAMATACLILFFGPLLAGAGERPGAGKADAKPVVQVVLSCSTKRLDPFAPGDHFLQCTVRNVSEKPVEVPTVYVGGHSGEMSLTDGLLRLVFYGGPKAQQYKRLEPGQEATVFRATLRDVLRLDFKNDADRPLLPGQKRYYWDWRA